MHDSMIFTIQVLLYMTSFILGFITAKVVGPKVQDPIDAKGSFFKPAVRQLKPVSIDEKKFVTDVSTTNLVKKGGELGTKTVVNDDVGASASKLAQLKKNK